MELCVIKDESSWSCIKGFIRIKQQIAVDIGDSDPEMKKEIKVNALMMEVGVLDKLETSISSWIKLVRI